MKLIFFLLIIHIMICKRLLSCCYSCLAKGNMLEFDWVSQFSSSIILFMVLFILEIFDCESNYCFTCMYMKWYPVIIFYVCHVPVFRTYVDLSVVSNSFSLPEFLILPFSFFQSLSHPYLLASPDFLIYLYCPLSHQRL